MPVSLDVFAKNLLAAGLSTADEVKVLLADLPAAERPADGDALAKLLQERGKITAFQAKHLLAGKAAALTVGEYLVVDRIGAGEQSAQLEPMLARVADIYQTTLQQQLQRITTLMTPLLTILIGAVVGGLLLSVMGAIVSVNELAVQ